MRLQKHPRGRGKNDHLEFRVELSVGTKPSLGIHDLKKKQFF